MVQLEKYINFHLKFLLGDTYFWDIFFIVVAITKVKLMLRGGVLEGLKGPFGQKISYSIYIYEITYFYQCDKNGGINNQKTI